jgi:hypothetical protein
MKTLWNKIKDWSGWSEAGSIFVARLEVVVGFLISVFEGLDWSYLMSMDFSQGINKQVLFVGLLIIVKGLISEITRRHNATDL